MQSQKKKGFWNGKSDLQKRVVRKYDSDHNNFGYTMENSDAKSKISVLNVIKSCPEPVYFRGALN